jgi:hypothetical protein
MSITTFIGDPVFVLSGWFSPLLTPSGWFDDEFVTVVSADDSRGWFQRFRKPVVVGHVFPLLRAAQASARPIEFSAPRISFGSARARATASALVAGIAITVPRVTPFDHGAHVSPEMVRARQQRDEDEELLLFLLLKLI